MKKDVQLNVRLDAETNQKLEYIREKSGKAKGAIIRDLINKGTVNVYYGQRDVLQRIARVEDAFNKSTLAVRKDMELLNKNLANLHEACSKNDRYIIQPLEVAVSALVDRIGERCADMRESAEKELCQYVNI